MPKPFFTVRFSKSGFSSELKKIAAQRGDAVLVGLGDNVLRSAVSDRLNVAEQNTIEGVARLVFCSAQPP